MKQQQDKKFLEAFGPNGLDAYVSGVGTGGTISGVSHALKAANSNIQVFAVEADESAILSGENLDLIRFKVSLLDSSQKHLTRSLRWYRSRNIRQCSCTWS